MDLFELEKKLREKLKLCAETALSRFISQNPENSALYADKVFVHDAAPYVQIKSSECTGNISFKVSTANSMLNEPQASFEVYVSNSFFKSVSDFLSFFKEMSNVMYLVARADFRRAATGLKNVNVEHILNQVYFTQDVLLDMGYLAGAEAYSRFDPVSWSYGVGIDAKIDETKEVSFSFFKENIDDVKGYLGYIVNKVYSSTNIMQVQGDLIQDRDNVIPQLYKFIKEAENGSYR